MYSRRFAKAVIITNHARARMAERNVDESVLLDVIETGQVQHVDRQRIFLFKRIAERRDNLVCAAAVEEKHLVIKTVMVNWTLREQP